MSGDLQGSPATPPTPPEGWPAPRIAPGTRRDVGTFTWVFAKVSGRVTGTEPPRLFLTLGRHRKLFRGWLRFAGRLMPGGTLPRRETELVIIRVAHTCGNLYEFEHHRRLGRRAGVSEADVERLTQGPEADGWTFRERAILTTADELVRTGDVSDPTWTELRRHIDERSAIELLLLAGHYQMLAGVLTALRVQPDRPRRRAEPVR
ncbi:MAG: carboxymuconolactone decarboxylase family protein [Acidimicrobiales bacterium]|nr:carboxymuconolactone decarboxylase family protein [Acidimicrobiales bacterium]